MNQMLDDAIADLRASAKALAFALGVAPVEGAGEAAASPLLFELEVEPEDARVDLALFLIEERQWPANAFTAHAVKLFAAAVRRRYVAVRGCEPEWADGWVYRGLPDYLIVQDTYEADIAAIAEQLSAGDF